MEHSAVVFGWNFDTQGSGQRLNPEQVAQEVRNAGLSWAHLNATDDDLARSWLQQEASYLDAIILDALLAEETRPRALDYQDGMLLILRGVNTNPDEEPEDMVSLRVWIEKDRIITIERRKVASIRHIDQLMIERKGPKNAGDFLAMLSSHLFENMEVALGRLHDRLDDLEEKAMKPAQTDLRREALDIRRAAITFRRYVAPQRDVLAHLRFAEEEWISSNNQRSFQEDLDQIIRTLEDLDLMRERAQITYETINSALAQRTNRHLYFLSGIATIFMPLTFVTGLFGMNVAGIPEANHPHAFAFICVATIGLALLQALIFKIMKWF